MSLTAAVRCERGGERELDVHVEVALVLVGDEAAGQPRADEAGERRSRRAAGASRRRPCGSDVPTGAHVAVGRPGEPAVEAAEERAQRAAHLASAAAGAARQSAGLSVSALKAEMSTDTAIVTANCWYMRPVMPGMNAVGTNTAARMSAIATTGPDTSSIALKAASRGDSPCSMWCSTASTTTMASSTTRPMASTRPKSDSVLIEKPEQREEHERADQRHRHRQQRDQRGPEALQEDEDDDDDEDERLERAS